MSYFELAEAAQRYDLYRPKVHAVIKDWLSAAGIKLDVGRALDIACGTGDSTLPLVDFCGQVLGIDQSQEMLNKADEKDLTTHLLPYQQAASLGRFDLITTCMAFHWFDAAEAVAAYKAASKPDAIWLIYNFGFGGSANNEGFNRWFVSDYLTDYPSPARNATSVSIADDPELSLLASASGDLPIQFSKPALVKYLTTQSNIEATVRAGSSYQAIEQQLLAALGQFELGVHYKYNFQYQIYRYSGH